MTSKSSLRKQLNQVRQTLSPTQVAENSRLITEAISSHFLAGQQHHFGIYLPFGNEVDLRALLTRHPNGHIPSVSGQAMQFQAWKPDLEIKKHPLGMMQPDYFQDMEKTHLDVCFMPLLGFDAQGHRLGMGGGFYDRYFEHNSGTQLIGVAHDCQQVDSLPVDNWDVKLHAIVTESQIIKP